MFADVFSNNASIVNYHDYESISPYRSVTAGRRDSRKAADHASIDTGRDRFVSHLYQARWECRRTCETAGKSGKQIQRYVIGTFRIAESMGFKGEFLQWGHLLRIGDDPCYLSCARDSIRPRFASMFADV
jgi:hypothetical protein